MDLLRFALSGNYKRFYRNLKNISEETGISSIYMFLDTALSTIVVGSGLQDYLNYRFYEKSWKERKTYVTIGYQAKFYKKAASLEYAPFFSTKTNFFKNFNKYTKRDWYDPNTGYDELKFFLKKHEVFIMKPTIGLGGADVEKKFSSEINDSKEFYNFLVNNQMHLEEFIVQDPDWGKISPNSVNTLRVMTSAVAGKSKIFFAAARIGNGSCVADNFHSGGMAVLINREKGELVGTAFNKKLEEFTHHPTTGIKIDGYKIPFWKEIQKMVLEAALVNENVNVVGWDVAITPSGPLIIEGNRGPGWDLVQILLDKGTKYMLEEVKVEMKKNNLW